MLQKTSIPMGVHRVDLSQLGTVSLLPASAQPTLGALSLFSYKRATLRWTIDGPGAFDGVIKLKTSAGELPQQQTNVTVIVGVDKIAGAVDVDLASVQGQTKIEMELTVSVAGSAGAQVWAALDIEYANPSGC